MAHGTLDDEILDGSEIGPVPTVSRVEGSPWRLAACIGLLVLTTSCLPGDDRPIPGSLRVTGEPSEAIAEGVTTEDGWRVRFERFVTTLGQVRLRHHPTPSSDSCNDYADTRYEWLFDFTRVRSPQKVGLLYGLGTCRIEFSVGTPSDDTVVGAGATGADLERMRRRDGDFEGGLGGASLFVRGRAERRGVEKRFEWTFQRPYEVDRCAGGVGVVELVGEKAISRGIVVRGEELFRRLPDDTEPLHFDPYAAADADGDGAITMEELHEADPPSEGVADWLADHGFGAVPQSLFEMLYVHLLPRVARLAGGGECEGGLSVPRR